MTFRTRPSQGRIIVAALSLSAAAFVGLTIDEGYTSAAIIPTRGDVPTMGFGSTTHADGRAVKMGDTTTPPQALQRTLLYLQADEADMRRTLQGIELHQAEYDIFIDWRYQYGATAWRSSSMLRELRAGNYPGSCQALLRYRYSAGFDCSTPGNRVCSGVWTRQLKRHAACMAAQSTAAIDQQKVKAGQLLQAQTDRANAATAKLIELKTEREKHDAENKSTIADLAVRLRAAAGPAARLHDPNARPAGCGIGGSGAPGADLARAGGGAGDDANAGGLFSARATELLQRLTREADDINVAYVSCRADALSMREVLQ